LRPQPLITLWWEACQYPIGGRLSICHAMYLDCCPIAETDWAQSNRGTRWERVDLNRDNSMYGVERSDIS
jgi:hypothetical protein